MAAKRSVITLMAVTIQDPPVLTVEMATTESWIKDAVSFPELPRCAYTDVPLPPLRL
jgi:hypothetical protein